MTQPTNILDRFLSESGRAPLFLPDLTLWYDWHSSQGTLPVANQNATLPEVAQSLGLPIWLPVAPFRVEYDGAVVTIIEQDRERVIRSETANGVLTAKWIFGPGGEWWQTEYPVKSAAELRLVLEFVQARSYVVDGGELARHAAEVGDGGVVALKIPRRPLSDLFHEYLGWSEGLMLMADEPGLVQEILDTLEAKLQALVAEVTQLPTRLVWSPDNLDGQFISPRFFNRYLAQSYAETTRVLHQQEKQLVAWVGGPVKRLLPLLAAAGLDTLEGVSGPPQSDATLAEARAMVGPGMILWGGISQDYVLAETGQADFEALVQQAAMEVNADPRAILGITDRVPPHADISRLQAIPALLAQAMAGS